MESEAPEDNLFPEAMGRFRRWLVIGGGAAVLLYGGYAVLTGAREAASELLGFQWALAVPILLLTLVNYGLRFFKWAWLLGRLDVHVPLLANALIFTAGLAMAITPGKAGELLKPYLVRSVTGAPMLRTIPALVAERGTDAIAIVALAAIGVSTYHAEGIWLVATTMALLVAGVLFLSIRPLPLATLALLARLPGGAGLAERLRVSYVAMRTCLSPWALTLMLVVSVVAWGAECVGYWLIFQGLGVTAGLDASTFLYSFATVFGAPSPGGMGMADAALVEGARNVLPGITAGQAVAAALLVRVATLWFGVLLGGLVMLRMEPVLVQARARVQGG